MIEKVRSVFLLHSNVQEFEGLHVIVQPSMRSVCEVVLPDHAFLDGWIDAVKSFPPVAIRRCEAKGLEFGSAATILPQNWGSTGAGLGYAIPRRENRMNIERLLLMHRASSIRLSGNDALINAGTSESAMDRF